MTRGTIIITILAFYLIAMFLIGLKGRKYSSTNKDTMTAAKSGGLLLVAGSYLGAHIGNGVVVGGAQYGAVYGIGGAWYGVGTAFSYILFAIVMAKVVYNKGYITLADPLREKYGDKVTTTLIAILHCATMIAIAAGQIMAGKLLFQYVGLSGEMGAIITFVVVMIYSAMSGMWGVMMTDVIQSTIIFIACIGTVIWMGNEGAFSFMSQNLEASNYELVPFDLGTLMMMFGPTALYGLISAPGFQRTAASKSLKIATVAPIISAVIIIGFAFIPVLFGMYAHALWPEAEASTILFKLLLEAMPPLLGGLIVCAIIAAVMSTCDGGLLAASANIVNDIYLKVINPEGEANEKKLSVMTTVSTICIGLVALLVSLKFTMLVSLLSMAYSMLNAGALWMILGAVFWKKATTPGAIAGFVCGIGTYFLINFGVITVPLASIFPLLPSLIGYVVVCLLTQPKEEIKA